MNIDIEKLLSKPPQFTPPVGLKKRLIEEIPVRGRHLDSRQSMAKPVSSGWLRRWWSALVPATVSVACAVVMTVQHAEISGLKATGDTVSAAAEGSAAQAKNGAATSAEMDSSADFQQQIARLKDVAVRLKAEVMELQQLQGTENPKLRAQLATPQELGLTPEEFESLAKAKEKAL